MRIIVIEETKSMEVPVRYLSSWYHSGILPEWDFHKEYMKSLEWDFNIKHILRLTWRFSFYIYIYIVW